MRSEFLDEEAEPSNWNRKSNGGRDRRPRRKTRFEESESIELVAAGFADNDQGRDNNRQGSRSQEEFKNDRTPKREWRRRPRDNQAPELSPDQELNEPCKFHLFRTEATCKLSATHTLRECRKMLRISDAFARILTPPTGQPGGGAPQPATMAGAIQH